jgi:DNA-binding NarL/FixJ family response regulator
MKVALISQPGLFTDGVASLLQGLRKTVEVTKWPPDKIPSKLTPVDLLVVDVESLRRDAGTVVHELRTYTSAPIVAIADILDERQMAPILAAGATAYITKAFGREQALDVMQHAIEAHATNGDLNDPRSAGPSAASLPQRKRPSKRFSASNPYKLTRAEAKVLALVVEGHTNLSISKRLGIKESTVKLHAHSTYKKLGVDNRTQAAKIGARMDAIRNFQLERAQHGSSVRDWLLPHMTDEFHRKGDVLFKKGDPGQALYYVHKGQIALPEIGEVVREGDLLGEIGIFSPEQARTCTARCETDAKLFRLTAEQARRLYLENPQFAYHVVQLLAQRFSKARQPGLSSPS